jgi:hypothetical protein
MPQHQEKTIDDIFIRKAYFCLGGMQMQLSMVTSETLKTPTPELP